MTERKGTPPTKATRIAFATCVWLLRIGTGLLTHTTPGPLLISLDIGLVIVQFWTNVPWRTETGKDFGKPGTWSPTILLLCAQGVAVLLFVRDAWFAVFDIAL